MSDGPSTREQIKKILVESLNLEEMTPEMISDDMPLWGEDGLGLDSVDALELMVDLEQRYGIRIEDEDFEPEAMATVARLEEFITGLMASQGSSRAAVGEEPAA